MAGSHARTYWSPRCGRAVDLANYAHERGYGRRPRRVLACRHGVVLPHAGHQHCAAYPRRQRRQVRRLLSRGVVRLGTVTAGKGVAQAYVEFPEGIAPASPPLAVNLVGVLEIIHA